jgi:hypothetical protein
LGDLSATGDERRPDERGIALGLDMQPAIKKIAAAFGRVRFRGGQVTAITSVVGASLEAATLEAHQEPGADGGHESHAHQE